jgi:hypothetical protein
MAISTIRDNRLRGHRGLLMHLLAAPTIASPVSHHQEPAADDEDQPPHAHLYRDPSCPSVVPPWPTIDGELIQTLATSLVDSPLCQLE